MIKLENVNKSFGELILFENLNLEIDKKKDKNKRRKRNWKKCIIKNDCWL